MSRPILSLKPDKNLELFYHYLLANGDTLLYSDLVSAQDKLNSLNGDIGTTRDCEKILTNCYRHFHDMTVTGNIPKSQLLADKPENHLQVVDYVAKFDIVYNKKGALPPHAMWYLDLKNSDKPKFQHDYCGAEQTYEESKTALQAVLRVMQLDPNKLLRESPHWPLVQKQLLESSSKGYRFLGRQVVIDEDD